MVRKPSDSRNFLSTLLITFQAAFNRLAIHLEFYTWTVPDLGGSHGPRYIQVEIADYYRHRCWVSVS